MRSLPRGLAASLFQFSLVAAVCGLGLFFDHASQRAQEPATLADAVQTALERDEASDQVRGFIRWVMDTGDHGGLPFVVVDKTHARLYAFGPLGQLRGSAPVVAEAADAHEPMLLPAPAGRFINLGASPAEPRSMAWAHDDVVLVLRPSPVAGPRGQRSVRLASTEPGERRASEAELQVAGGFFREYIDPLGEVASVAYVLPDASPAQALGQQGAMQRNARIVQSSTRRFL